MTTTTTPTKTTSIGMFSAMKHVIVTICTSIVKACTLVDTSLDAAQDIADSGRILTSQLKEETLITAKAQLKLLDAA